jgi:Putative peptidoglycan binding domain
MLYFKKFTTLLLISLFAVTSFNISSAQQASDEEEEIECTSLSHGMRLGSRDATTNGEVSKLQVFLSQANYLDTDPTGYYGQATRKAVRLFQSSNNLISSGNVGAVTRAKIKSVSCGDTNIPTVTNPASPNVPITQNPNNSQYCPSVVVPIYRLNGQTCYLANRDAGGCYGYKPGDYASLSECESTRNKVSNIKATVASAFLESNDTIVSFNGSNFKVDGGEYYVAYRFDCANGVNCSGSLTNMSYASQNKLSFNLDENIKQNAKGNIALVLTEKAGEALSAPLNIYITEKVVGSFKLKAPTDIERGNVITTIKAGGYMNVCWEKPVNFTDQPINLSLIDSQVKGGSNVLLGSAYLSQNCFVATVPTNFSAGITNIVATNANNSLYSNSPSFEVVYNMSDPVINSFNFNEEQNFSLNASNFASISFKAECGNGVGAVQTIRNGYFADVIYLSGSDSICNEYQSYQKMQTSNTLNQVITSQPLSLWRNGQVDGSRTWILSPQNKNISGDFVIKVKVCNAINKCVEAQAPGKFYSKG